MKILILISLVICINSIASLGNTFYVAVNGNNSNSGESFSKALKTLHFAVSKSNEGDTILLGDGFFVLNERLAISKGLSIKGKGVDKTIIGSDYFRAIDSGAVKPLNFLIYIENCTNSVFEGFTLNGNDRKTYGGVFMKNSKNIELRNVSFESFNYCALYINDSESVEVSEFTCKNSAWPNKNGCSGAIMVGNLLNSSIHDGFIQEDKGYGIKTNLYKWTNGPKEPAVLENFDVYNLDFDVEPYGAWENGMSPNFCIEYWNPRLKNCRIFNCYFNVTISLPSSPSNEGKTTVEVFNNQFVMTFKPGVPSYAMEAGCPDMVIHHNYFKGGYYPLASFGHSVEGHRIHHNIFEDIWGIGIIHHTGLKNFEITNNTFFVKNDLSLINSSKGLLDSIVIHGNLFYCNTNFNHKKLINVTPEQLNNASLFIERNWFYNWVPWGEYYFEGQPDIILNEGCRESYLTPKKGGALNQSGYNIGALSVCKNYVHR